MPGGAPYRIAPNSYYLIWPPINWGGVYIGLNGGYGLGSSSWTNSFGSTGNFAVDGGVFSGTLGINYAGFGDWVLLDLEGDFDWSGASGSGCCSIIGGRRRCWAPTQPAKPGLIGLTTAGGAADDFRISTEPTGAGHNPSPPLGWTAGGGIEYLITDAISAKVEYLYVNLGTVSCPQGAVCSIDNPDASNGSVSFSENLMRAGVNYKFSW